MCLLCMVLLSLSLLLVPLVVVVLRLIAELRRLGACVVFASFQKVIIATNKSDVKAARDYAKFVVSTVTSRDLFNTLQVHVRSCRPQLREVGLF